MIIQIYAFTNIEEALEAVRAGVTQVGFVAGRYDEVHAELSFEQAARLAAALPAGAKASALTMATDLDEIVHMAEQVQPDIVHISSDLWQVDAAAMAQLRDRLADGIQLMKAIPVTGPESLEIASSYYPVSDYLLLDSKVQGMPGVGATGKTHDWDISARIAAESPIPVILAGGLTPENVAEAIRKVKPDGVDSNTGTNLNGDPVEKDMKKVIDFTQAALDASKKS